MKSKLFVVMPVFCCSKASAALVPGLALASCVEEQQGRENPPEPLDRAMLETLGRLVLPSGTCGDDGVSRVVGDFLAWLEGLGRSRRYVESPPPMRLS